MTPELFIEGEIGTNRRLVDQEEGANKLLVEGEELSPRYGIGNAPRNSSGFFFIDDDGDWAVGTMAEARGRVLGTVFRDADGDIAIDTVIPPGRKPVETQIDWNTLEVTVPD